MKLQLMFILMDLFTMAIIPFAFLLEIMHKFKKGVPLIRKPKTV